MHCDVWGMVYGVLHQRTGQTLWSHQYDHTQCPFDDKADALAKQAAATHPLQLRPCVLRRPRESSAPSGSRNVRAKGNAEGAAEHQPILASQQQRTRRRPREPSAHSESRNVRPKDSMTSLQGPKALSQRIQVMVEKWTRNNKASRALLSSQVNM